MRISDWSSDVCSSDLLRATPVGMKRFKTEGEMEKVERLRRPPEGELLATDQIVGQARWLGYTIGITMSNLMGQQCGAVVGLAPRDEEFLNGKRFHGETGRASCRDRVGQYV